MREFSPVCAMPDYTNTICAFRQEKVNRAHTLFRNEVCGGGEGVRLKDHHAVDVVAFVGERTEQKEPALVLIQTGNLTMPRKEKWRQRTNQIIGDIKSTHKINIIFKSLAD